MLLDPGSGCASPLSIDGVAFGAGTWLTSRISTVQVGQMVLDRYSYDHSNLVMDTIFFLLPYLFPSLLPHCLTTLKAVRTATLMALKAVTSNSYAYLLHDSTCLSLYIIGCGSSTMSIQ